MDLRDLANIAVGSSSAGFGASAGRDLYKNISKNWLLYVILTICFAGVGYAFYDASRGNDRGLTKAFLVTFVGNIVIAAVGIAVSLFCLAIITDAKMGFPWKIWFLIEGSSSLIGLAIGLSQRSRRIRSFDIATKNESFLEKLGLQSLGGSEDTWIDADDNELKMMDIRDDAIVFRIHGKRGMRALLKWNDEGQFVDYSLQRH